MAGWGTNVCEVSKGVNEVTVPVLDDQVAEDFFGNSDWDRIICVDTTGGGGTCSGTSGGPLMVGNASGPLTGIASFGSTLGCDSGVPSCFTAIPSYLEWLNENGK